jgi:aldose 1-epimerase
MSPFVGRCEHGRYEFRGKKYELSGIPLIDPNGHVIHGFCRLEEWNIQTVSDSEIVAKFHLEKSKYSSKGYPWDLTFQINYHLHYKNGLTVTSTVQNTGDDIAPFGFGHHPYYLVPHPDFANKDGQELLNNLEMQINANSFIEYDKELKPTGTIVPVSNLPSDSPVRFDSSRQIGTTILDNCYTDLQRDNNGIAHTYLSYKQSRLDIWQDNSFPYVQVYTFDGSTKGNKRHAMAIEAETSCGFALNVPDLGLLELAPSQEWSGTWGVKPEIVLEE